MERAVKGGKKPGAGHSPSGFMLLEVMASVAILGLGIILVIELLSGALGLASTTRDHTEEVMLAREKTAETLVDRKPSEGLRYGRTSTGLNWEVEVTRYEDEFGPDPLAGLLKVETRVWREGREGGERGEGGYTLTTLRRSGNEEGRPE